MTEDEIKAEALAAYRDQDLLTALHDEGENCASEYHDDMVGYFGWSVESSEEDGTFLLLSFSPSLYDEKEDCPIDFDDTPGFSEKYQLVRVRSEAAAEGSDGGAA